MNDVIMTKKVVNFLHERYWPKKLSKTLTPMKGCIVDELGIFLFFFSNPIFLPLQYFSEHYGLFV
jgi:hypothetical protein